MRVGLLECLLRSLAEAPYYFINGFSCVLVKEKERVCVCVCVCVRERETEIEREREVNLDFAGR